MGINTCDDAGVFRIRDDLALIQTLDFFTPVVDDPYDFGRIAAANALSDIYAMGGKPITAMNIICFPINGMDIDVLKEILRGGLAKIKEAGALLVGGHSVDDEELKYGLSVTGTVHPDRLITNKGACPGDHLILTKSIGTGIINTAIKGNLVESDLISYVTELMAELNSTASEVMHGFSVHACTDVTGFGLIGHICEMIEGTGVGLRLFTDKVPLIEKTKDFAGMGMIPAGTYRNKRFRADFISDSEKADPILLDILFDPQTSGGLLIAIDKENSQQLLEKLKEKGVTDSSIIGEFFETPSPHIILDPPSLSK